MTNMTTKIIILNDKITITNNDTDTDNDNNTDNDTDTDNDNNTDNNTDNDTDNDNDNIKSSNNNDKKIKNVLLIDTTKIVCKKERKKRIEVKTWNFTEDELTHSKQVELLNILCNNNNQKNNKIQKFRTHIKSKISCYKQQDIHKKIYNNELFITFTYVLDLLVSSNLKCCYCSTEVYILYELVRESKQWTLDRINNDIGHNIGNLVIACLECNLKRRRTNKDSFMFEKNMKIIREGIS
jgi:hypothetical protein